ncbi:coil containing protein [Vibrio phage 1.175.O._10N.261.55.B3]|nr:coil containing protein [Vibrio phage 1.175.O._10N.261.55.B3]
MEIYTRELKQLELKLLRANKVGFKVAQQRTTTDLAFEARTQAVNVIKKEFTLRNTWTARAGHIPVVRASRSNPNAEFGSTLEYMRKQEEGFVKQPDRFTKAVAIPTPVASGERKGGAQGKTIRRKPVRKQNRRSQLKMPSKRMNELPRRERNAALIKEAIKSKRKNIELFRNGESNIWRVTGTMKKYRLDRLYKTEHKAIIVKPTPWLAPATKEAVKKRDEFYMKRMQFQVDRMMKR